MHATVHYSMLSSTTLEIYVPFFLSSYYNCVSGRSRFRKINLRHEGRAQSMKNDSRIHGQPVRTLCGKWRVEGIYLLPGYDTEL